MYCPTCGQQQINDETRFCSRCGFLLADVAEVIANKGISPYKTPSRLSKKDSPRKRGIKIGAMIMLVGNLLIVPIIAILQEYLNYPEVLIPLVGLLTFMGGLLRIIYAYMFESKDELVYEQTQANSNLIESKKTQALPPQQSIPVTDFVPPAGSWRTTNELAQPPSVTESTTKLLEKEE